MICKIVARPRLHEGERALLLSAPETGNRPVPRGTTAPLILVPLNSCSRLWQTLATEQPIAPIEEREGGPDEYDDERID